MDLSKCNSLDELKQEILRLRNENRELKEQISKEGKEMYVDPEDGLNILIPIKKHFNIKLRTCDR